MEVQKTAILQVLQGNFLSRIGRFGRTRRQPKHNKLSLKTAGPTVMGLSLMMASPGDSCLPATRYLYLGGY